jgi:hypothetical protein
MNHTVRQETMLRKPILMPPSMIERVSKIAKNKKVSFAAVVRDAVSSFDGDNMSDDEAILEALADIMIKTTQDLVRKIDEIEKRLDDTHALLEAK